MNLRTAIKMKQLLLFVFAFVIITTSSAQDAIKKVWVETYYITDSNDATDTLGGGIESGTTTYRVYIQLKPGYQLSKIFGDNNHALRISSTENFFNNKDFGKSFGKDFSKSNYNKNTVALDTWLTIGQTTKKSTITYFGIPKTQDIDGSFIGGSNNDGGSAELVGGLLVNNNVLMGQALTIADGMDAMINVPTSWFDIGFTNPSTSVDSTIFGSAKVGKEFYSNNAYLQTSGVAGINPDSNQILVAQLTTKGELSFELNVEVKNPDGSTTKYVASGKDTLDEKVCGYLKYPSICGCMDADYFEFNSKFICHNSDSCKNRMVLGCMDRMACNFNEDANFNVQSLCCYPGMCADRDISLVCPTIGATPLSMKVYPNPAQSNLVVETSEINNKATRYIVYNSFGNVEFEKNLGNVIGKTNEQIDLSNLNSGIYLIQLQSGNSTISERFIKN